MAETTQDELRAEIRGWLESNWDADLTVGEWWERLAEAGWAAPMWPTEWFGRGLSRGDAGLVAQEIASFGALGAPGGLGMMLAGPTILAHASDDQKARYLRPIVTGQAAWCQLFSEPNAGSDLAGLQCRAERDGEEWIVNGQKVWTSGGQIADMGMLMARTDPDLPKHKGISWFSIDMHQPGMDVRPLTEMTGRALFNEVFLTDCRVADEDLVGGLNNGWAVGNTTLMVERMSLGAGGHGAVSAAMPGTVAGHLDKRAGDFVRVGKGKGGGASGSGAIMGGGVGQFVLHQARSAGPIEDEVLRQQIVELYTMGELARFANLRAKAARAAGVKLTGAEPNIAKLSMSRITRLSAHLALAMQGPGGMLSGSSSANPMAVELALFAPAVSIYGGTDEIQKNIIGERVLGLPAEPRNDKDLPFRDIPKN